MYRLFNKYTGITVSIGKKMKLDPFLMSSTGIYFRDFNVKK